MIRPMKPTYCIGWILGMVGAVRLLIVAQPLLAQTVPAATPQEVAKLIAVLKSDAPQKDKVDACRGLAIVGTKEAVPALAGLLGDEKLAHMARYALEPIPDPSVDAALREALGRLKGRPLAGVIGSLGVRRDGKAVEPLARFLNDANPDVAQAAARALGSIGTAEAAKALESVLGSVPEGNRLAVCEGLFRAAESLAAKGQRHEALAAYARLNSLENAPHQVRAGALRGLIVNQGKDGLPLLRESLRSADYVRFAAAVRATLELREDEVSKTLALDLGALAADRQIVVIQALGHRGSAAALPVLLAMVQGGAKPVRLAAIRALAQIPWSGGELWKLIDDPDPEIARAAQESLAAIDSREVDAAVIEMLASGQARRRLLALEFAGRRRMTVLIPHLLKAADDPDAAVRSLALRRLGELGGAAELPALLEFLRRAKRDDAGAVEQAGIAILSRLDRPEACAEKLATALADPKLPPERKPAVLRMLGTAGGAKSLGAVRTAAKDPSAEVRAAAIRVMSAWKTAEAVPDLLALAEGAKDPTEKMLALRGYLAWAAKEDVPAEQRLAMCRQAARLAQTAGEKKLLLAALGSITLADSLVLAVSYLDDPETRDEAGAAAVSIAEKLLKREDAAQLASKLVEPLKKAVQAAPNPDVAQRAKAALEQAQAKGGRK